MGSQQSTTNSTITRNDANEKSRLIWKLVKTFEINADLYCDETLEKMAELVANCSHLQAELTSLYSLNYNGFTPFELSQILLKVLTLLSATVAIDDHAKNSMKDAPRNKVQGRHVAIYFDTVGFVLGGDVSQQEEDDSMLVTILDGRRVIDMMGDGRKGIIIQNNLFEEAHQPLEQDLTRTFALPSKARKSLLSVALLLLGEKKQLRSVSNCPAHKRSYQQHDDDWWKLFTLFALTSDQQDEHHWMLILNWRSFMRMLLRTSPYLETRNTGSIRMNFLSRQSTELKRTVKLISISTKFFDQGMRPSGWIGEEPSTDSTARELWEHLKTDLLHHTHPNSCFRALILLYLFHPSYCTPSFYLEVMPQWMESWRSVNPTPEFDFLWVTMFCRARKFVKQADYDWAGLRRQLEHVHSSLHSMRWDDSHSESSSLPSTSRRNSFSSINSLPLPVEQLDEEDDSEQAGLTSSHSTHNRMKDHSIDIDYLTESL